MANSMIQIYIWQFIVQNPKLTSSLIHIFIFHPEVVTTDLKRPVCCFKLVDNNLFVCWHSNCGFDSGTFAPGFGFGCRPLTWKFNASWSSNWKWSNAKIRWHLVRQFSGKSGSFCSRYPQCFAVFVVYSFVKIVFKTADNFITIFYPLAWSNSKAPLSPDVRRATFSSMASARMVSVNVGSPVAIALNSNNIITHIH